MDLGLTRRITSSHLQGSCSHILWLILWKAVIEKNVGELLKTLFSGNRQTYGSHTDRKMGTCLFVHMA
jgi:hypothetical protein